MGVIKVFYSSTPGNMQVREHQSWLERTFAGRGVQYEKVDIAAAGSEKDRKHMIEEGRKSGKKVVLPPQVFVDDKYIGGYEELWEANECEQLLTVLGLAAEPAPPAPATVAQLKEPTPEPAPVATDGDQSPVPVEKEASPSSTPAPEPDAKESSPAPDSNANAGGAAVAEEQEVSGTVEPETE